MKTINDYENPFDACKEFENALIEFTGAPGVIVTDCCTHAIELGLRYKKPEYYATIPKHTYLSVPMTLHKLDIDFAYRDEEWDKVYRIEGSNVWDAARMFEKDMFRVDRKTKILCVSFGHGKPLEIGHGGAILTNDRKFYEWARKAVYDGRDFEKYPNWHDQKVFDLGFHYHMRPEDAIIGLNKLSNNDIIDLGEKGYKKYPDLSEITINT